MVQENQRPRQRLRPAHGSSILLLAALSLITLLAAAFRLGGIDSLPPALYHDEAQEGLDALKVLEGWTPIYFPDNNGREPLFVYLAAISTALFGRTPGAVRIVSALAGAATIPGLYLVGQSLYGRRVGLLTAIIGATTIWPILLSRLGTRPALLPLVLTFGLWQGLEAWRTNRRRHWLMAGLLLGVAFYTYTPVRVMPLALLAFALYLAAAGQARRLWPGSLIFSIAFAIALAPLAAYAIFNWSIVFGRVTDVSAFDMQSLLTDFPLALSTFSTQTLKIISMIGVSGDLNPRHNIPGRPIFDLVLLGPVLLGLGAAYRARRKFVFLCLWMSCGLLPTFLSDQAPHFLRSAAILPVLFIFPALGLDQLHIWLTRLSQRPGYNAIGRAVGEGLSSVLLLISLSWSVRDLVFQQYLAQPDTIAVFDGTQSKFALDVNRLLNLGWLGENLIAVQGKPAGDVWIEDRLRSPSETFAFLVQPDAPIHYYQPEDSLNLQPGTAALIIVSPDNLLTRFAQLPPGEIVAAADGPWTTTTGEDGPPQNLFLLYRTLSIRPLTIEPRPLACFGDSLRLLSQTVEVNGPSVDVRLLWQASRLPEVDLTVFVHILKDNDLIGQHDGPPAAGLLPTSQWRQGEVVEDLHTIPLPAAQDPTALTISIGLYQPQTLMRLAVTDCAGGPLGDTFTLK